jgi:hypothetical protein
MSWFELPLGLVASIDRNTFELRRIADALERLSPSIPLSQGDDQANQSSLASLATGERVGTTREQSKQSKQSKTSGEPYEFHLAESPEEYQARTDHEAALAISLGVAPWSPQFQQVLTEMRQRLTSERRMVLDEEGNQVWQEPFTASEAEDIIRQAFQLAKAEANTREPARQ